MDSDFTRTDPAFLEFLRDSVEKALAYLMIVTQVSAARGIYRYGGHFGSVAAEMARKYAIEDANHRPNTELVQSILDDLRSFGGYIADDDGDIIFLGVQQMCDRASGADRQARFRAAHASDICDNQPTLADNKENSESKPVDDKTPAKVKRTPARQYSDNFNVVWAHWPAPGSRSRKSESYGIWCKIVGGDFRGVNGRKIQASEKEIADAACMWITDYETEHVDADGSPDYKYLPGFQVWLRKYFIDVLDQIQEEKEIAP